MLNMKVSASHNKAIQVKNLYENSKEIRQMCGYLPGGCQAYKYLTGNEYLNLFADLRKLDAGDFYAFTDNSFCIFWLSTRDLFFP